MSPDRFLLCVLQASRFIAQEAAQTMLDTNPLKYTKKTNGLK